RNCTCCTCRSEGSSTVQNACPAIVVGSRDAARTAAENLGLMPRARAAPATSCAPPLTRTISSSSMGSGTTRRILARVSAALPTRPPGGRTTAYPPGVEARSGSTMDADDQLVIDGKWYHASDLGKSVGGLADSSAGGPNDRVPTGDVDRAGKCAR